MKTQTQLIIAELSANHNQSLEIAKDSIRAIAECGADGVKLQTYTPECLTLNSNAPQFCISGGTFGINDNSMNSIRKHKLLGNGIKSFSLLLES